MSYAWRNGSSRRYRRIRAYVLARDARTLRGRGGRCMVRLPGVCTGWAQVAHHTLGRKVTGDDPRYMVAACEACNLTIGEPTKRQPQPKQVTKW
jgi:hypothetical protein